MNRRIILFAWLVSVCSVLAASSPKPDIVVAADGSGDFKTIQAAVASISATNRERIVVLIKNGTYREKIRVDASFVTLRGQSRTGTRIEFPQLNEEYVAKPDSFGRAVINLDHADDFVLENLTAVNTAGIIGPHAFTIYGTGDRTVIVDCDVFSHGADTVSMWLGERGRYYHARCNFSGSVDFVCPRGWCYITDCTFYEHKDTAAVWHDGRANPDMKFVMRNCRFAGTNGFVLGRHHVDAQFYFLDCTFSAAMADRPIKRVIYPLGNAPATEADIKRNADLDKQNLHGERSYFYNCHRDGGDFPWFANNLATAEGSPKPKQITPEWTFAGKWDPEKKDGPVVDQLRVMSGDIAVVFSEPVTVRGMPQVRLRNSNGKADYYAGSGTDTLLFRLTSDSGFEARSLELNGGTIFACQAGATLREADVSFRGAQKMARKAYEPPIAPPPKYGQHMLHPDR